MKYRAINTWNVSPSEAVQIQKDLRSQLRAEPLKEPIRYVAGCDVSNNTKFSNTLYAGVVVLDFLTMKVVDKASAIVDCDFPYTPGLLSFRELPALLKAWEQIEVEPDVVIVDGHGIAHRRRMGIAAHFGLIIDKPTLGCAKKKLVGTYVDPGPNVGDWSLLVDKHEPIGAVYRSKGGRTNPLFISPGHRMDIDGAIKVVERCLRGYKLPEPTLRAHNFVNEVRREHLPSLQLSLENQGQSHV